MGIQDTSLVGISMFIISKIQHVQKQTHHVTSTINKQHLRTNNIKQKNKK
jgi:hypothetical protein